MNYCKFLGRYCNQIDNSIKNKKSSSVSFGVLILLCHLSLINILIPEMSRADTIITKSNSRYESTIIEIDCISKTILINARDSSIVIPFDSILTIRDAGGTDRTEGIFESCKTHTVVHYMENSEIRRSSNKKPHFMIESGMKADSPIGKYYDDMGLINGIGTGVELWLHFSGNFFLKGVFYKTGLKYPSSFKLSKFDAVRYSIAVLYQPEIPGKGIWKPKPYAFLGFGGISSKTIIKYIFNGSGPGNPTNSRDEIQSQTRVLMNSGAGVIFPIFGHFGLDFESEYDLIFLNRTIVDGPSTAAIINWNIGLIYMH